jgi:predicted phosphoribosyltransferase
VKGYADRHHAGSVLAGDLTDHGGALVLGIPRGGVVVAAVVARALDGDLDVAIARKVGAPFNPELAMGAVGVDGVALLDEATVRALGVSAADVDAEVARQTEEARRRLAVYRGGRPPLDIPGRTVIVVDDGVATGATMKAVLMEVRRQSPRRLICAVPCAPPQTIGELTALADEVVCPLQPPTFMAVGQWYRDFTQVTDDEVVALLAGDGP